MRSRLSLLIKMSRIDQVIVIDSFNQDKQESNNLSDCSKYE